MRYTGAGRKVYPGFVQLLAFMSMNLERHMKAHRDLHDHLVNGEVEQARRDPQDFYDEYLAVLDLSAEFYLETVQYVFQDALLAKGELEFRGRRVDPAAIRRTALLTVEGERDDICAARPDFAAHDLCTGLRPYMKRHHLQAGRRALRRVQRPALGDPDLPDRAQLRALGRVRRGGLSCGVSFLPRADHGLKLEQGLAGARRI